VRADLSAWVTAAISAGGAITAAAALLRSSSLARRVTPGPLDAGAMQTAADAGGRARAA
jgi:hypothetical protein